MRRNRSYSQDSEGVDHKYSESYAMNIRFKRNIGHLPIMSNEFHLMAVMTIFDTVDTDCISFSSVACSAAVEVVHGKTSVA